MSWLPCCAEFGDLLFGELENLAAFESQAVLPRGPLDPQRFRYCDHLVTLVRRELHELEFLLKDRQPLLVTGVESLKRSPRRLRTHLRQHQLEVFRHAFPGIQ